MLTKDLDVAAEILAGLVEELLPIPKFSVHSIKVSRNYAEFSHFLE